MLMGSPEKDKKKFFIDSGISWWGYSLLFIVMISFVCWNGLNVQKDSTKKTETAK